MTKSTTCKNQFKKKDDELKTRITEAYKPVILSNYCLN